MISSVIVDDEPHGRNVLKKMLITYCPNVQIIGEAESADEAYALILNAKPALVFLDVKMPEKSGFDLLHLFSKIDFEVIFVSAFNEYAVTAFEFNALGYVLKPIDSGKLVNAVKKAEARLNGIKTGGDLNNFINTLEPSQRFVKRIPVHHNQEVVFININEVIWVQSVSDVCEIALVSKAHYYSSKDLKLFEELLKKSGNFVRINKNCILNLDHLKSYQKGEHCFLKMSDDSVFEVSRRKKTEILNKIHSLSH